MIILLDLFLAILLQSMLLMFSKVYGWNHWVFWIDVVLTLFNVLMWKIGVVTVFSIFFPMGIWTLFKLFLWIEKKQRKEGV